MFEFFSTWSQPHVIGLVSVIGSMLVMIVGIVAASYYAVRRAAIEADLKRDLASHGLSVEQIERLIAPAAAISDPVNEKELEGRLASVLVEHEIEPETMAEVMRLFQSASAATKAAIAGPIEEIVETATNEEHLVTAVRSLCATNTTPRDRFVVDAAIRGTPVTR